MKVFVITGVVVAVFLIIVAGSAAQWLAQKSDDHVIKVSQIQKLQKDKTFKDRYVIVDTRAPEESSVSMLPGAITMAQFEKSPKTHQGKTVIAYCTIGYRSGKYAAKLRQQGWSAFNYKGSILDWCKQKLPLITPDGKPTKRVHTYSSRYAAPAGYEAVFEK